jgi:hypothetical protein
VSSLPSRNSSEAPPPVEMCVISAACFQHRDDSIPEQDGIA